LFQHPKNTSDTGILQRRRSNPPLCSPGVGYFRSMRIGLVLWIAWLSALPLFAQQAAADQGTWLWTYRTDPAAAPNYLFASLHHPGQGWGEAISTLSSTLGESAYFASVWPADAVGKNDLLLAVQRSDAQAIRKEYRKTTYDELNQLVAFRLGDELVSYASWQPLYLRHTLQDAGRRTEQGRFFDEELFYLARGLGLPTRSLVEVQDLARQLNGVPLAAQLDLLRSYTSDALSVEKGLDRHAWVYAQGSWEALAASHRTLEGEEAALRTVDGLAALVAAEITVLGSEPGGFLAVPAELLGGASGVLALLRAQGGLLEPVALPAWAEVLAAAFPPEETPASLLPTAQNSAQDVGRAYSDARQPEGRELSPPETAYQPLFSNLDALASEPLPPHISDPFSDLLDRSGLDTAFLQQWVSFQPREKDFQVKLPMTPELLSNTFRAEGGEVDVQLYLVTDPLSGLYLLISRSRYPPEFRTADPLRFFDQAMSSTRERFAGLTLAERVLSSPLYRGREFVLSLADGRYLRGKLMLADNDLYQVVALGDRESVWSSRAEIYLRSFQMARADVRTWSSVYGNGFRVQMPIIPRTAKRTLNLPEGQVHVEVWSLDDPVSGIQYFLSRSVYPPSVSQSANTFLERTAVNIAANIGGRLLNQQSGKSGRRRTRFVEVETPDKHFHIRFYLEGSTLYQVMAGVPRQKNPSADVVYFLRSFAFQ
jgi:hypothetical protein